MSIHLSTERDEPPDDGAALLSIPDPPQVPVDLVVKRLFPPPTLGQLFYTRFLERASHERTTLPDEPQDTTVICTRSIATLARELGIGHDTTQKYVVLYRALGLLKKRKLMGKLAFAMRTGIYHPTDHLEANLIHLLQKSRPKLRQMTSDVLGRCKIYGLIAQDFQAAAAQLQDLLHPQPGETRRTLEQRLLQAQQVFGQVLDSMQRLLQTPGKGDVEWVHPTGILPIEAAESPHTTSGRHRDHHAEKTPLLALQGDSSASQPKQKSTQIAQPGRFDPIDPSQNLSRLPYQGDSAQLQRAQESPQIAIAGGSEQEGSASNLPKPLHWGDSSTADSIKHSIESTHTNQKGRRERERSAWNLPIDPPQGDSSASVLTSNVNVITLISNITSNVKLIASFCRQALDEPPSKQRIYLNLFSECEHDAQAIAAALLFTLAHRRDGTMTKPAAVFIARCRDFHRQGVSEEAAALVQQYGSLSYRQLLAALQKPVAAFAPSRPGTSPPASPSVTPTFLPPLPQWGTIPRLIEVEHGRSGMSRQEALQVVARAQADRRTKLCRVDLERLANGTYAVLLDNTITTIPRQTYFYSLHEWEARTATIKDCFELFGVAPMQRRSWTDLLKERGKR